MQSINIIRLLITQGFFLCSTCVFTQVSIDKMLCENREKPLGVDDLEPKLSWVLTRWLQLKITYIDGTFEVLGTDDDWKSPGCPVVEVEKHHDAMGRLG